MPSTNVARKAKEAPIVAYLNVYYGNHLDLTWRRPRYVAGHTDQWTVAPYADIQELKKVEEMVETFYNSNQFTHTLPVLEHFFEGSYEMFLALGDYYEEQGYFVATPARAHKYQILLAFVKEHFAEHTELFRELLTFDYYLRENAKSRPDFARDISKFRQEMTDYYKAQEAEPDVLKSYVEKGYDSKQMFRMTHMETFRYPVWEAVAEQRMTKNMSDTWVLFDYDKRNPLTYEAQYYVIRR